MANGVKSNFLRNGNCLMRFLHENKNKNKNLLESSSIQMGESKFNFHEETDSDAILEALASVTKIVYSIKEKKNQDDRGDAQSSSVLYQIS
ncbi:hypothetical protein Pint_22050 [Pistacia integerrima]|uniref:Uncharacterized protein n=1 Tax=Pistacia integerrima TaxID=434235 RepID=A0ACC0YKM4_9ROSI|nr:hypothetical protein Pint_22050 [Pistacia integerrima]